MDKQHHTNPFPEESDQDDYPYADQEFRDEDDQTEKTGQRVKSPERRRREKEFVDLYNAYMNPTEKLSAFRIRCQQDDLYTLLYQLNSGWAHRKVAAYISAGFVHANAEDALSIGCYYAHSKLLEDKAAGNYVSYPVAHYLRLAQNKAIDDYFRKEFGRFPTKKKKHEEPAVSQADPPFRRKEPYFVSIDGMNPDSQGEYHNDRNAELSYNPFAHTQRPEQERRIIANRLSDLFITELLNYSREPQKPLAVMYGNILFQLAKLRGSDDLSQAARASTKVFSPSWAHTRMGSRTLLELGDFSEQVLCRFFSKSMLWGPAFRYQLEQRSPVTNRLWAKVVYTETYSEDQTSDWIESITKTINQKCARQAAMNQELVEFVEESFSCRNKFRKALTKIKKEAGG